MMQESWTDPSHVGKISISIMDTLADEFFKESQKPDDEKDHALMIKLSQAVGYQSQVYSTVQKNHDFARRLKMIEGELLQTTPVLEELPEKNGT
jgi:isopenicillin N synthase-like dioxygenase|tara:strand:- start:121 stop:402 length:282 start_codon:yes stop_codon:yes gene_type:complete